MRVGLKTALWLLSAAAALLLCATSHRHIKMVKMSWDENTLVLEAIPVTEPKREPRGPRHGRAANHDADGEKGRPRHSPGEKETATLEFPGRDAPKKRKQQQPQKALGRTSIQTRSRRGDAQGQRRPRGRSTGNRSEERTRPGRTSGANTGRREGPRPTAASAPGSGPGTTPETPRTAAAAPQKPAREAAPRTLFPPPPSRWIKDISSPMFCGSYKCAFGSNMNRGRNRTQFGYLLAQQKEFKRSAHQTRHVQMLHELHGISHFMQGQPQLFNVTATQMAAMDVKGLKRSFFKYKPTTIKEKDGPLIVQPIQLAPENSILFGCMENKNAHAWEELRELAKRQQRLTSVELQAFEERASFDLNATQSALHSAEGACLYTDFQVFVDPDAGSIHHVDFDFCPGKGYPLKQQNMSKADCLRNLRDFLVAAHKQRGGTSDTLRTVPIFPLGLTHDKGKGRQKKNTTRTPRKD